MATPGITHGVPDLSIQVKGLRLDLPVGGRLIVFSPFWEENLPLEATVRGIVTQGYKIPFRRFPKFQRIRQTPTNPDTKSVLFGEVDSLLKKGAIRRVEHRVAEGFYSTYFLVPKKTGDLRPILNLKPLNGRVRTPSFRMVTVNSVKETLWRGDWMATLDLKDAYFHVPIHQSHWKYLRFCINSQCYEYKVLPFGLSTSPRIFTKVLAPVLAFLAHKGIQTFPYIDDILVTASSEQELVKKVEQVVQTLNLAGFLINVAKSSLSPSQDKVFIGARFQTSLDRVSLPVDRASALVTLVQSFHVGLSFPARLWLSLLGKMASTIQVTRNARLFMRPVQMYVLPILEEVDQDFDVLIQVTPEVHHHLQWWSSMDNLLSGLPLSPDPSDVKITTDASSLGWGAVLGEEEKGWGSVSRLRECGTRSKPLGT